MMEVVWHNSHQRSELPPNSRERISLKSKENRRGRQQSGNNDIVTVVDAEIEMKRHHTSIDCK